MGNLEKQRIVNDLKEHRIVNNLRTSNPAKNVNDVITTGQQNPKGLIGAIALGVIAVGALAIKCISK